MSDKRRLEAERRRLLDVLDLCHVRLETGEYLDDGYTVHERLAIVEESLASVDKALEAL